MKFILSMGFILFTISMSYTQTNQTQPIEINKKGTLYFYWGWNNGSYTNSDIHFSGDNYDFELFDVQASDRQSAFSFDTYFNPSNITIPQYNFRLGYYISDLWDISIGDDHMKYVMVANQNVKISGHIDDTDLPFHGVYEKEDIQLTENFLKFEHTDGLNYLNIELRRQLLSIKFKKVSFNLMGGVGVGALVPRTNTTLLGKERYDEFHLAGFGLDALLASNIIFYDRFFLQFELKGGYINMPDIRTTHSESDRASQSFLFLQTNIVFGGLIRIFK